MAGAPWKKSFSMWRAAIASKARRRNERVRRACRSVLSPPGRCNDAALLVSAALVVAAAARPGLLADRADADLGIPAILHRHQRRLFRARRRHLHRRGAAVGH